ncbi:hypothetical protein D3C72_1504300 [compost metagenome]
MRATNASTKRSCTPSVTIRRDDAVHFCPVPKKAPFTAHSTASSRSASSSTTRAFLLPISSWQRTKLAAVAAATRRPVSTEPVKLRALMPLEWISRSPTSEPLPITRLKVPAGRAWRAMISVRAQALAGTALAGLNTTALPKARAGAIFQAAVAIGKFHGVMMATTPTGSRRISISTPGRTESAVSPICRRTSAA